jgi:hypothetical protein
VENLTVADADGGFLVRIGYHEVWRVTGAEIRRFWGEAAKSEVDFSGRPHQSRSPAGCSGKPRRSASRSAAMGRAGNAASA